MGIPTEDWIHIAKRLPVGRTTRITYKRDTRPNLVIGHDDGKFWCYCQKRKEGGVVEKSHVMVTGAAAPQGSTRLDLPSDRVLLRGMDEYAAGAIAGLLAAKNVDALFLPQLWFSEDRKRLLMDTGQGWLGRDTTGRSDQKWLTYQGTKYLGSGPADSVAVVVEDPFSYYKVKWALREQRGYTVYCALGTVARPVLALKLALHQLCIFFLDGDAPGYRGADAGVKRLRGLGTKALARCAPEGMDPKDMAAQAIREHLSEAIV